MTMNLKYASRYLAALLLITSVIGVTAAAQQRQERWEFEEEESGQLPSAFKTETGRWEVVQDLEGGVLAQVAENRVDVTNLVLIQSSYKNLDLSVRMRAVGGENERGGGLVFRARDKNNYYVARYNPYVPKSNPKPPNFRLYKVENGVRTQLDHADAPEDALPEVPGGVADGTAWHVLRITMHGQEIIGYLDGKKLLEAEDATFRDVGKIGLWTKSDARSLFDDLKVSVFQQSDNRK